MARRRPLSGSLLQSWPTLAVAGVATLGSLLWLDLIQRYVNTGPGWDNLLQSHPTDFALFLAAASAPLAVLWLVAGFVFIALAQVRMQTAVQDTQRQLARSSGEIEALIRTNIEMQEQARRQSFLNGAEMAIKDLNSQAGLIAGRLGILSTEETEYLWALNAAGDPWAFCHALLERAQRDQTFPELMAHRVATDEVASAGLQRFLRRYDHLVSLAKNHDADRLVREVLEDGPMDHLYALFQRVSHRVQDLLDIGGGAQARAPAGGGPYDEASPHALAD